MGVSRGIGLEFVRQLLARGERIIATIRSHFSSCICTMEPGQKWPWSLPDVYLWHIVRSKCSSMTCVLCKSIRILARRTLSANLLPSQISKLIMLYLMLESWDTQMWALQWCRLNDTLIFTESTELFVSLSGLFVDHPPWIYFLFYDSYILSLFYGILSIDYSLSTALLINLPSIFIQIPLDLS